MWRMPDARIFHYGWVRPPELMNSKIKSFSINHRGVKKVSEMEKMDFFRGYFDYGNLNKFPGIPAPILR